MGAYRGCQQFHGRLKRSPPPLLAVAVGTRANHILPSRFSTLRTRDDVIQTQLTHRTRLCTILTAVSVSCEKRLSIEPHR